jgi:hypothetical protein
MRNGANSELGRIFSMEVAADIANALALDDAIGGRL